MLSNETFAQLHLYRVCDHCQNDMQISCHKAQSSAEAYLRHCAARIRLCCQTWAGRLLSQCGHLLRHT